MRRKKHWLVRPCNIKWLWGVFAMVLVLSVAPNVFLRPRAYFGLDGSFGFFAWYGFVTCTAMVFISKWLGWLVKRKDDYYHDD